MGANCAHMKQKPLTYTPKEVAHLLGVSQTTVYRLILRRVLKVIPDLRHKRIPRAEIDRLLGGSPGGRQ